MNGLGVAMRSVARRFVTCVGLAAIACVMAANPAYAQSGAVSFAVIGDYGLAGPAESDVATLVKEWDPDFVITVGDNNYEDGEAATIDRNIGQYFHEYICPYLGSYGPRVAGCQNRFFPTLGNHDWRVAGARPYLDYFTLPGNERYYDMVIGPVHLFALDSDPFEPDGVLATSTQGEWLRTALGASAAPWKVVYFHHAPYSSGASSPWMRWPFREWGASIVLAGHYHNYERLDVGGLAYIVNGLGGATIYGSGKPISGSQVRFDKDYGAVFADADDERMTLEFRTRTGELVDIVTLHAGAGALPTVRFEPVTVTGGASVTGVLLLDSPAPAGGSAVTLSVDMPAVLSVPSTVKVPDGATSVTFTAQTVATATPVAPTLTAGFGSTSRKAALTVMPPILSGLALSPTRTMGGLSVSGTVTLSAPAAAGGAVVSLSSNHGAARPPARVTVAAGATSAQFTIGTDPVSQDTSVVITAADLYATRTATLTLGPLLRSLSLSPTAVAGGVDAKGTVTLNAPAREGGAVVQLSSGGPQAVPPASVTVPAGATTATFVIATSPVVADVIVPISASLEGMTRSATLTVKTAAVSSLSLNPTSLSGGATSTATVTLSGPAPAGGVAVDLSSANPQLAAVPPAVTIAAGLKSATFQVTTTPVTQDASVLITAGANGTSKSASLAVKVPLVSSLALSPASVTGGGTSKATVTLNNAAPPGGITVALSSANPTVASVPTAVSVAAGAKTASVTVTTTAVTADTPVALTASLNGASKSVTLTVKAPVLSSFTVSSSSLTGGGSTKATITLTGVAAAGGLTVALSSGNPVVATLPASATIAAGAKSVSVTVTTVAVTADTAVALTASVNAASKSATLTVKAPVLSSFTVSPSSLTGGASMQATITLTGVAPAGGLSVALASANPAVASLPASASIAAGAKTGSVTVDTVPVPADSPVVLTATLSASTKSATVTVKAPALSTLTVSPTSVSGGGSATATVSLSGAAPANGVAVALSSSHPSAATVPATVTVPSGAKTVSYPVATAPVAADTAVTLGATLGAIGKTTTLTVKK